MTSLDFSEWPSEFVDPHSCGSAPFVPDVSGPIQNSCKSYKGAFDENGCNAYRPNYPDDLYIEKHGCGGVDEDCKNGVPQQRGTTTQLHPPVKSKWPAEGYFVPNVVLPSCKEGFSEKLFGGQFSLLHVLLIVLLVWLFVKYSPK